MPNDPDVLSFVDERYDKAIAYYWKRSADNKRNERIVRVMLVVLGALTTLFASLSAASFAEQGVLKYVFDIGTPVLAATLTIVGGFSQSFQFGATWQDMVMTAQHLEMERDRIRVTEANKRKPQQEVQTLNDLVLTESRNFFGRLIGSSREIEEAAEPDE